MTDAIEIGTCWDDGIVVGDGYDMELDVESGFDVVVEAECDDESEVHLVIGDIVEESKAADTEYDFDMLFADVVNNYVYVGPALPDIEVEWSTDAWFRTDAWFHSEAW